MEPLWKTKWRSLKKLKIELPIPFSGPHLEKTKVLIRKDTRTPIFTVALSIYLYIYTQWNITQP